MAKSFQRRACHFLLLAAFALALTPALRLGVDSYRTAADEYDRSAHARANTVAEAQSNERLLTTILMMRTPP